MMQAKPFADDNRVTPGDVIRNAPALVLFVAALLTAVALWTFGAAVGIRYAAALGLGV